MNRILAPAFPLSRELRAVINVADALQGDDDDWSLASIAAHIQAVESFESVPALMGGMAVTERGRSVVTIADRLDGSAVESLTRARLLAGAIINAFESDRVKVDVAHCGNIDRPISNPQCQRELIRWRAGTFLAVSYRDAASCATDPHRIRDIARLRGVPPFIVRGRVLHEQILGRLESSNSMEHILAHMATASRNAVQWISRELGRPDSLMLEGARAQ